MNRINAVTPENATGKTKELYEGIKGKLGRVPNVFTLMGNSPAVLEGYLKGGTKAAAVLLGRDRLTPREREVVQLLAEGKSTKEVAVALGLSVKTAETHRSNIMRKLQLHSVSDLVMYAVRNNIVHVVQSTIE